MRKGITRSLALLLMLTLLIAMFCVMALATDGTGDTETGSQTTATEPLDIVKRTTKFKYLDNGIDPAAGLSSLTAWTLSDFDDSSWKTGAVSFGSNSGKQVPPVNGKLPNVLLNLYKSDGSTIIPTFFFRTTFEVEDASLYNTLSFKAYVDDSFAMYINGVLVYDCRTSQPAGTNMYYSSGTAWEHEVVMSGKKFAGALKNGTNQLAIEVHDCGTSGTDDIYFGIDKMTLSYVEPVVIVAEQVVLGVGSHELERGLSWFSNTETAGEVRLAKAADVVDGVFPTEYATYTATSAPAINKEEYFAKKATLTNLEASTEYAYTFVVDGKMSDIYYFSTGGQGDFEFVFAGDPQLDTEYEGQQWSDTLTKIGKWFDTHLVISSGDQINIANNEKEYSYFLVDELANIAFAPTVGPNHDSPDGNQQFLASYSDHFYVPNLSDKYGVSSTSANYWFTYNNTLFMNLNMSDASALEMNNGTNEHKQFMQEVMAAHPDARWTIVILHTSLFSTGDHSSPDYKYYEGEIKKYRAIMAPIFTELGIDVVLSGHDHIYARSKMMDGTVVSSDVVTENSVTDPKGTLHVCASSSTGSKFCEDRYEGADYVACENFEYRKSVVSFKVTHESITLESYFLDMDDQKQLFDTFTIYKHVCAPEAVEPKEPTCTETGKEAYYVCDCGLCYEDENGTVRIDNLDTWGVIPAIPHVFENYTETAPTCTENAIRTATCELGCGTIDTVEVENTALGHSFGEWKSNGDGTHKRVCGNDATHTETEDCNGGEATEDKRAVCTTCGGEYGDYLEPTPEPAPEPKPGDDGDSDGLGTGALVAIVVGAVVGVGGGGFALFWFVFRKRRI